VLREADACREPGEIGALLRRHGLYSSHLVTWRREREQAARERLSRKRGRKPAERHPLSARVAELERDNRRLEAKLRQAEIIIDIQKKASALLGIPLNRPDNDGSDS
jgi:transposase-like protein